MPVGIKATQIERDEIAVAPPRTFLPRWLRADPKSAMILAGLIVLAIAAAVLMQVRRDHQVTLKAAELRLTDLAWGSSMAVRGVMENTERVLSLAVTATRTETPNAEAALATLTRLEPLIVNIILLGPDGMLRASKTGRAPYPQFFTNQPFYEAFLKNGGTLNRLVGPFADSKLGASPIALFVRITDEEGQFDGIAIALLDPQALARRIGTF